MTVIVWACSVACPTLCCCMPRPAATTSIKKLRQSIKFLTETSSLVSLPLESCTSSTRQGLREAVSQFIRWLTQAPLMRGRLSPNHLPIPHTLSLSLLIAKKKSPSCFLMSPNCTLGCINKSRELMHLEYSLWALTLTRSLAQSWQFIHSLKWVIILQFYGSSSSLGWDSGPDLKASFMGW